MTQLFRDKDGTPTPVIRLRTPFLSDNLSQTGFMGCPNATLKVRGGNKRPLPPRAPWMCRDQHPAFSPTQASPNPALGLPRLRGCPDHSSEVPASECPSSAQLSGLGPGLAEVSGPPWDFSLAGIPGWPVCWSFKPAPLPLCGTWSLSTFGNSPTLCVRSPLPGVSHKRLDSPGSQFQGPGECRGHLSSSLRPADWGPGREGAEPTV